MKENDYGQSITRRKFIEKSIRTAIVCGLAPSVLFKTRPASGLSLCDVEELCPEADGKATWKDVCQLSRKDMETFNMDLTPWEKTPRHSQYTYVAAKLAPPYTATEIAYMLTVGQHFPWWTHEGPMGGMMINNRGGLNYYTGQREVWSALSPDTLEDYLYRWPENKIYMWILDRYHKPALYRYTKFLQNVYRCGKTHEKYSDKWHFYPGVQKLVTEGEARYSDQYFDRDFTYGDTAMIPWYYTWRFLGTDVLYNNDTVRFPDARKEITIRNWDGQAIKQDAGSLSIMGKDYPAYNSNGGVPCYVMEATANCDFFAPEHKRLILWVDMYAHRELRRERYDLDNNLMAITEAKNRLELKDKGKWGYSILIYLAWDLKNDHMSANHYDFHRFPRTFEIDPEKPEAYFRPNPVFMESEMFPVPFSTMVFSDPEAFYLRPKLMPEKFPRVRKMCLSEKTLKLVKAQNEEKMLIFI
ncbi:MAG: hypothetical protein KJ826_18035 [Proteobacteria bacterium]|nr:hypothetical protein [Pseudomonadota bacterium]MBU4035668.1 hypothetical protein [Pseudomonadota bacterium]